MGDLHDRDRPNPDQKEGERDSHTHFYTICLPSSLFLFLSEGRNFSHPCCENLSPPPFFLLFLKLKSSDLDTGSWKNLLEGMEMKTEGGNFT